MHAALVVLSLSQATVPSCTMKFSTTKVVPGHISISTYRHTHRYWYTCPCAASRTHNLSWFRFGQVRSWSGSLASSNAQDMRLRQRRYVDEATTAQVDSTHIHTHMHTHIRIRTVSLWVDWMVINENNFCLYLFAEPPLETGFGIGILFLIFIRLKAAIFAYSSVRLSFALKRMT